MQFFRQKLQSLRINYPRVWMVFNRGGKLNLILLALIGLIIYKLTSFPEHLQNIEPQQFEVHALSDDESYIRDLKLMKPKVFIDRRLGMCEDIEVGSNEMVYCVNQFGSIIGLDTKNPNYEDLKGLLRVQGGKTYGLRLSKDEKILYFVNSKLGLCQFDIEKHSINQLASQYQGQFLSSLNSVEIDPQNKNILYITQSSTIVPLDSCSLDLMLNNPFGRVFQFNKKTRKLTLLADRLYFPNGIVFQKYRGERTVLVAETSRLRLSRIYVKGQSRGMKQIALDKLEIYPDNLKMNQKGQIWIGSMGNRYTVLTYFLDDLWVRKVFIRLLGSLFFAFVGNDQFGGAMIKFSQKDKNYQVKYQMWRSYKNYKYASTMYQKNDKLFISSFCHKGILVIDELKQKLNTKNGQNESRKKNKLTTLSAYTFGGRF